LQLTPLARPSIWPLFSTRWPALTRLDPQKLPAPQLKRIVGPPSVHKAAAELTYTSIIKHASTGKDDDSAPVRLQTRLDRKRR
jgi:hypothetical protein